MQARFAVLVAAVVLLGCSTNEVPTAEPTPPKVGLEAISVTPASVTLAVGARQMFVAVVSAHFCPPSCGVTWASSDTLVASVTDLGVALARAPGRATITARALGDANFRAGVQVTVTP